MGSFHPKYTSFLSESEYRTARLTFSHTHRPTQIHTGQHRHTDPQIHRPTDPQTHWPILLIRSCVALTDCFSVDFFHSRLWPRALYSSSAVINLCHTSDMLRRSTRKNDCCNTSGVSSFSGSTLMERKKLCTIRDVSTVHPATEEIETDDSGCAGVCEGCRDVDESPGGFVTIRRWRSTVPCRLWSGFAHGDCPIAQLRCRRRRS